MKIDARENTFIKSRKIKDIFTFIAVLLFLSSCVGEGGRKGRPFIKDFSIDGGISEFCSQAYRVSDASCLSECPGIDTFVTHIASDTEIATTISTVQNDSSLTTSQKEEVLNNINSASQICLEGSGISRPENAIFVKKDFCACKEGNRSIVNNCDQFCATKTQTETRLFGSVTLGPEVELNTQLGNLSNWCNIEINEVTGPSCVLEVFDGSNTSQITIDIPAGSNTFSADISNLLENVTHVAKIVEVTSGASSDSFQIYKIPQDDGSTTINTPLKILPSSMYSCIFRDGTQGNDNTFNNAAKVHYFYASNSTPPPMPANNVFDICHDVNTYGTIDSPLYPRLELIPQQMALWDFSDIRFADVNPQDGVSDINSLIEQRLLDEYNEARPGVALFGLLPWKNFPNADVDPNLGFIMQAFIDPNTGRGFCPGQEEYNGSTTDNLFRVLKEIIGVDTEGLYMSEREPIVIPDGNGGFNLAPNDFLMIREGQLRKIWFYFENNQHFVPDEVTSSTKTIHFYWPPDETNPYVKKSYQQTYTVRAPEDLGQSGATSGLNTSIRPPDKRFACIPALD